MFQLQAIQQRHNIKLDRAVRFAASKMKRKSLSTVYRKQFDVKKRFDISQGRFKQKGLTKKSLTFRVRKEITMFILRNH